MKIFKEEANIISIKPVWVCIHNNYLYIASNLFSLFYKLLFEWNDDKHLVG
jgi:hypothetical protein